MWASPIKVVMLLSHKKYTRKRKRPQEVIQRRAKALLPWIDLAAKVAVLVNALAELIHKLG